MRAWLPAVLVLLTACGSVPVAAHRSPTVSASVATANATPVVTTSPIAHGPLLFAALEAKGVNAWNTLAIAGLDGYARAKTTFVPIPAPVVGCAGAVPPPSAHAVAGKVYFVDGTGTVRSLSPSGTLGVVAKIPFTGRQQMISFAISPDGSRLLASVFSLPQPANADPCKAPQPFLPGDFTQDVYQAKAGGGTQLLYHQVLATAFGQAINPHAFVGWDAVGPEATYPTQWATQGGGPHPYGIMSRVDAATGKVVGPTTT